MKSFAEPAQIAWALIWRSTLLAPIFLIFYVIAIASWIGRFYLPVLIIISVWVHDWPFIGIYGVSWVLSLALWRWRRFRLLWEAPPSLL